MPTFVLAEVPVESNLKAYTPKGGAVEVWRSHDPEIVIEGPAETGKTLACLHKIDAMCWKYPGLQVALIRKTQRSMYGSVIQTYQRKIQTLSPDIRTMSEYRGPETYVDAFGGQRPEQFLYPNGSTIWVGGMDNPDKVLSSERDVTYVNQCEELALGEWETLLSRTTGRAGNCPYSMLLGDCNPSAPTHWILARARQGHLRLVHSRHEDNPMLWDDKKGDWTTYGMKALGILKSMTGARKSRLLHGLWVVPEGVIFETYDDDRNKCVHFIPPNHWPRAVGVDPKGAYIGAVFGAYDPENNQLHIYGEYLQPFGLTTEGHVKGIHEALQGETIWRYFGGGPSERQERLDYGGWGLPLEQVEITSVWAGIDRVSQLMAAGALVIHDNCIGLLSDIGTYRRVVDRNGQPTENIENKESYHLADSLRYLVCGLTGPAVHEETQVFYNPAHIGADY